jgi:hypothetical protein
MEGRRPSPSLGEDMRILDIYYVFQAILCLRKGEEVFLPVTPRWDIHLDKKETTFFQDGVLVEEWEVAEEIVLVALLIREHS